MRSRVFDIKHSAGVSEEDADDDADCTHFAIDPATGEKHFRTRTVPIEGPSFCHWEMISDELREVRAQTRF